MSLLLQHSQTKFEAGIDEAGRGCLAGPVVAAAVILPQDFEHADLTDSKKLSHKKRMALRPYIQEHALAWNVGMISAGRIDQVNILNATYEAMHEAVAGLGIRPEFLSIDGNRFRPYPEIPHACIVKGDGKYLNIAAASILAKTYRDELMEMLGEEFPHYDWSSNKGYPTKAHKTAIQDHGPCKYHRRSFNWKLQLSLF
ncbi:MAG: ribonuclease HII [Bacteroidia bacterium]|nr:ribonuclease HII [Bacteroidia bacterium]